MSIIDSYLTIAGKASAEIKIQKSAFIGQAFPVKSREEIQQVIDSVRKEYYDAVHHPFAYRLGMDKNNFRYSDDGEPSGSSGKPVLEAIDKLNLTDTLVIVTRYFGGVKLGVGGLRRAYGDAAHEALSRTKIIEKFLYESCRIEFDYKYMNMVMRLIDEQEALISGNSSAERVGLDIKIRLSKAENFTAALSNITNGDFNLSKLTIEG
jgi:uncharacterized YigZ family protein